jgi:Rod binding domain-containing protein
MSQPVAASASQDLQQARTDQILSQLKNAQSKNAQLTTGQPQAGQTQAGKASDHQKLVKAAKSFEAVLLGKWLEQAEQSFAKAPGEDPDNKDEDMDGDPGANQFLSLGVQTLAQQIANTGGIGIAAMIVHQMEIRQAAENPAQAATTQQVTPVGTEVSSPGGNKIKVSKGKGR